MGRLTWKNPSGEWGINGVDFSKLDGAVYGALYKLKEYEETGFSPDGINRLDDFEQTQCAKLLAKLSQERESHRWIPVTERMPEYDPEYYFENDCDREYIVMIEGAEESTTLYYTGDGTWQDAGGCFYKVTAWMPLPEPYIKGNE